MSKKLCFLISFVLVLGLAGTTSAYPLEDAVAIWNLADYTDAAGPPYTDLESAEMREEEGGTLVELTGAEGALGWDGWAIESTSTSPDGGAAYTELIPPLGDELRIEGSVSILARVKMAGWVEGIEVVTGLYDAECRDTVPSYGIEFQDFGHPTFSVSAAGTRERIEVSLPDAVEPNTWYDILGVFDANRGRISVTVLDSATGSLVDSNTVSGDFNALDYTIDLLCEFELFSSPCLELPYPEDFAYIELVAVWAEVVSATKGAKYPRPADNATRVNPDNLRLIWDKDGDAAAASESVYFGTSFADVNGRQPAADKGTQDANYYPTVSYLSVDLGLTYYWAIDEVVDACAAPGPVWQFTITTTKADEPSPGDDANYVSPCPTLTWDPGYGAVTHKVYFDVNEAKVAGRTIDPCAVINEPNEESYTPGALAWDTEYFWAVDEVNASAVTTSGDVWSFTVGPNPATDGPAWRSTTDTLYAKWGFDVNWAAGEPCKPVADPNWVIPSDANWEPNCVDKPYAWLTSYMGHSGIADNNDPVANEAEAGYRSIRFKHNDYAIPGQNVIVRAAVIWTGASRPSITLERLTDWGGGPEPEDGLEAWEETDNVKNSDGPNPLYEYQLCDGWMYSVYEVEFETLEAADNIHVVVSNNGELYLDSVVVDAHWYTTPFARAPSPSDGAEDVPASLCKLTWYPGAWIADTNGHDVYFGTSFDDVNDANTAVDPNNVYMGPQDTASYPEASCLDLKFSTTYYWRIDEVNDACAPYLWKGAVWSFTTGNYFVVDDFEPYRYVDTVDLRNVWKDWFADATGKNDILAILSFAKTDEDKIYGGEQSMELAYRNYYYKDKKYHGAETEASTVDLEVGTDWTRQGVKALVLHFYGDAGNGQEIATGYHINNDQMYVALEDGSANVGIVKWPDMNDIQEEEWHEWNIDLQDPCLTAVDMANVVKVYIGFGGTEKTGQSDVGAGKKSGAYDNVWFDDIQLHPPRCVSAYSWPYGDVDEDCNVGVSDLDVMSADWLVTDYEALPVAPCDVNLIVEYLFDSDYTDTAGPPYYHGQASTSGATLSGGELHLDGVGYVDIGGDFNSLGLFGGTQDFSIAMWFKTSADGILISSSEPNDASGCDMSMNVYVGEYVNPAEVLYDNVGIGWMGASTLLNDGEWHHMATTYDAATLQHHIYADGVPEEWAGDEGLTEDIWDPNITDITTHTVRIGFTYCDDALASSAQYVGDINDVRIYDFALKHSHVLALAGVVDMQYFSLDSPANYVPKDPCDSADPNLGSGVFDPNNVDIINFKDYAVMANNWLEGPILWPPQP